MSLSTLLEAAKYLDYLDSNNQKQQQHHHQHHHSQFLQFQPQSQSVTKRSSSRRLRASKKNAPNAQVASSLPTSHSRPPQMQGVPIPVVSGTIEAHQAASLSSSFNTGSPLSSFASTALFSSKASGVTSASSSAASSLSSSDSSSSCGENMMCDNDFNQSLTASSAIQTNSLSNGNNNNHHSYHIAHQPVEHLSGNHNKLDNHYALHQSSSLNGKGSGGSSSNQHHHHQSMTRFIAATSSGPQLVTMTTTSSASRNESASIDTESLRAGRVLHTSASSAINSTTGVNFDLTQQHYMACVRPRVLNSLTSRGVMAFQPATASPPTSSSSSYSRHRELHKTLEKNRRAHLRHCFELLKAELPASECVDKKTSHINIIKSAIRYVLALRQQECDFENELQRLTRIKTELTENLSNARTTYQLLPQEVDLQVKQETQLLQQSQQQPQQQQPVGEQQLSFLLSQSKID